jgi:hypothetical protein
MALNKEYHPKIYSPINPMQNKSKEKLLYSKNTNQGCQDACCLLRRLVLQILRLSNHPFPTPTIKQATVYMQQEKSYLFEIDYERKKNDHHMISQIIATNIRFLSDHANYDLHTWWSLNKSHFSS